MSPGTKVALVTGAGGVGKTTISAALGAASARAGLRTLVLTVDPARRLAGALGLETLHNDPSPVPGLDGLNAAMLDVTASWDAIIERHAPPDAAARLAVNPFFRAIADRFPAAQSYAAGEQMAEYIEMGLWDLVVIDTPPSAGGIDFFLAPRGMRELVGGRLLRWLTGARLPARRTIYKVTARPMLRFADAVLGGPLLEEVADFLLDLRTIYDGLSKRATSIERYFRAAITLVVATSDPTPLREARRFFEELPDVAGAPAAVVFNRTLPEAWVMGSHASSGQGSAADRLALDVNLERWAAESRHQAEARDAFAVRYSTAMATIPWLSDSPTTLDELLALVDESSGLPLERLGINP